MAQHRFSSADWIVWTGVNTRSELLFSADGTHVTNARLRAHGQGRSILSGWSRIDLSVRANKPSTWVITVPIGTSFQQDHTFAGGTWAGFTTLFRDGTEVESGILTNVRETYTWDEASGKTVRVKEFSYSSLFSLFDNRFVLPQPLWPEWSANNKAFDRQTGKAEDVLLHFIDSNMRRVDNDHWHDTIYNRGITVEGEYFRPSEAPAALRQRLAYLQVPASQQRGSTITITGAYQPLGQLVHDISEAFDWNTKIEYGEDDAGRGYFQVRIRDRVDKSNSFIIGSVNDPGQAFIHSFERNEAQVSGNTIRQGDKPTDLQYYRWQHGDSQYGDRYYMYQPLPYRPEELKGSDYVPYDGVAHYDYDLSGRHLNVHPAPGYTNTPYPMPITISVGVTLGPGVSFFGHDVNVGDVVRLRLPGERYIAAADTEVAGERQIVRQADCVITNEDGQPYESVNLLLGGEETPGTLGARQRKLSERIATLEKTYTVNDPAVDSSTGTVKTVIQA